MAVTQKNKIRRVRVSVWTGAFLAALSLVLFGPSTWAQSVSGVRGLSGGVGALFSLTGPGYLYTDSHDNQGYMYTPGSNFESYSFRLGSGQAYSGGIMTLGPQLSVGLIQGANQSGSPVVFPRAPRLSTPVPPIQSSILDDFQPLIDIP